MGTGKRLFFAAILTTACASSGSDEVAARPSSASQAAAAAKACQDLADHAAAAYQRCGKLAAEGRAAIVDGVACGNCAHAVAVRDEASLRAGCFASLDQASCAVLLDPTTPTPAACDQQLTLAEGACHAKP